MDGSPQNSDPSPPVGRLILVPSLITLAVTLLRLTGELLDWSPSLFGKDAGGGGSLVGIAWLVPIFGIYFAVKLVNTGYVPASALRVLGACLAAFAVMFATGFAANAIGLGPLPTLLIFGVMALVAAWIAARPWPALGRTLFAYALAARIPVVVVALLAMLGNWGTHYDVASPDWPEMNAWHPIAKWLAIGLLPQITIWITYTIVVGAVFAALTAMVMRRVRPAEVVPAAGNVA
jgi:hypothetical protein